MKNKVKKWILDENLIEKGDTVICAVSGGADSVSMFHVLLELQEALGYSMEICHINHCLRGEIADQDAAFVQELAEFHAIPFHLEKVDVKIIASEKKMSEETAGRMVRYAFFDQLCKSDKTMKIATAHTASDQIETVLFNLLRGTGIRGLSGIPAKRGNIIRPLLSTSREEVEEYLQKKQLNHCEDESNASLMYTRNRIRHEVVPILRNFQPDLEKHFFETTKQLKLIENHLEKEAEKLFIASTDGEGGFDRKVLLEADEAILSVFFRKVLVENGISVDAKLIETCKELLTKPNRIEVNGVKRIESFHGSFKILEKEKKEEKFTIVSEIEEKTFLPDKRIFRICSISSYELQNLKKVHDRPLKNWIDCDRIDKKFIVRTRNPGDFFTPVGRGVSKTLKKLFNESGLTLEKRASCVIAECEKGIFWVEGFGVAEWASPTETSTKIAQIFIEGELSHEL